MAQQLDNATNIDLQHLALELGDDLLVLGHRLSEWCGHGPYLEEDIALGNIALDCLGQAQNFLNLAGELEGQGRDADKLAYFRDESEFRNCLLVEQLNGDFAFTIARQLFFDAYAGVLFEALQRTSYLPLAAVAEKSLKETRYHFRHAREWFIRLGDGTEESRRKLQAAVNHHWRFTAELSGGSKAYSSLAKAGLTPDPLQLESSWKQEISSVFQEAQIVAPAESFMITGGRDGRHSEHLGHMLAQMQIVARSYPDASW